MKVDQCQPHENLRFCICHIFFDNSDQNYVGNPTRKISRPLQLICLREYINTYLQSTFQSSCLIFTDPSEQQSRSTNRSSSTFPLLSSTNYKSIAALREMNIWMPQSTWQPVYSLSNKSFMINQKYRKCTHCVCFIHLENA